MSRERAAKKPPRPSVLNEAGFIRLMTQFSKQTRTTIKVDVAHRIVGPSRRVTFTSYNAAVDYEEVMPGFHEPGWAAWCAFRLLHPVELHNFETEIRKLFEEYKRGDRKWVTYNEEKRVLLQRFLQQPYHQLKKDRR